MTQGWETAKLKDLVSFVIGGDWGKAPDFEHEDYVDVLCIRGTELREWHAQRGETAAPRKIKASSLKKRQLSEGDLILEVSGGGPEQPVGRVELIDKQTLSHIADVPKICTNFFRKLEIVDEIDAAFLTHYLKFFYVTGEVRKYQAGSNNLRNLKYPEYETIGVPVPPLAEQQRIVEKIETLFARLDEGEVGVREVQKLLNRYRQSVLKSAVTGQLTANWRAENHGNSKHGDSLTDRVLTVRRDQWTGRGKYKEPVSPDTNGLPALPGDWTWTTVDALASVTKLAGFEYTKFVDYDADGDLPVIKAENVARKAYDTSSMSRVASEKVSHLTRSELFGGEVAMVFVGANLGRVSVVPSDQKYFLGPNVAVIKLFEGVCSPAYLETYLDSDFGYQRAVELSVGAAQGSISMGRIRQIAVALPPPNEQEEIVRIAQQKQSQISALERLCETELKRSASLRQSILKDAFAGRLVPQDPSDEPASALLARIAAEKAPAMKTRRKTENEQIRLL